jgi:4-hydroxybenzoate polyprenyltransferase
MGRRGLSLLALVFGTAASAGIFFALVAASGNCGDDPVSSCGGLAGYLRMTTLVLTIVLFFWTVGYGIFVVVESARGARGRESPPHRNPTR